MKHRTEEFITSFFERHGNLRPLQDDVLQACELVKEAFLNGNKLLICGNGGSCADGDHIAGEFLKGFLKKRPLDEETLNNWQAHYGEEDAKMAAKLQNGICAINLPGFAAPISAVINDTDPMLVYAQLVWAMARPGDVLIGISTSGGAKNVKYAAQAAREKGMQVISLTGQKESPLSRLADAAIRVPVQETYLVQEYHLPVYHWLCAAVEEALFAK